MDRGVFCGAHVMKRSRELLILRPDNIGDVVLFSGCLEQIRRIYPDHRITLAVQPHIVNLVELCPWVDRVIAINVRRRGPTRLSRLVQAMAMGMDRWRRVLGTRYDVVLFPLKSPDPEQLVLVRNHAAPSVMGMTGCRVNAPPGGYHPPLAPESLCNRTLDVGGAEPWRHELETNLAFLRFLGCPVAAVREIAPVVWLSDADRAFAQRAVSVPGPVIGIFPCASDPRKNWNLGNYVPWARAMESPGAFVVFGSPRDLKTTSALAASLKAACPAVPMVSLAGKTTLRQLAACIGVCDILLSVDSAGLHLGIAAGVPTVGILGGWHYGRFAPWGDPARHRIVTHHLPCFGCNLMCTKPFHECLHSVRPDDVAACCNELMRAATGKEPRYSSGEHQQWPRFTSGIQRKE